VEEVRRSERKTVRCIWPKRGDEIISEMVDVFEGIKQRGFFFVGLVSECSIHDDKEMQKEQAMKDHAFVIEINNYVCLLHK
jgi:hypothetical protein